MIKNESELRRILRADISVTSAELDDMAYYMRKDLQLVLNTSTDENVKSVAQEKIELIDSVFEYSERKLLLVEEDGNGISEIKKCRMIRQRLREVDELSIEQIYELQNALSDCKSGESYYLKGVLTVLHIRVLGDINGEDWKQASTYLNQACHMEPANELYMEYRNAIDGIIEERIRSIKEKQEREIRQLEEQREREREVELQRERERISRVELERRNKEIDFEEIIGMIGGMALSIGIPCCIEEWCLTFLCESWGCEPCTVCNCCSSCCSMTNG